MKRILIVEDQAEIRELIRMTLEIEDWDIQEASDGVTGLDLARKTKPDVVLLDVMMPGGMDGFTVCERLRADPGFKRTSIVMLTAMGRTEDKERGLKAGADAYLAKPFSPRNLLSVIDGLK
ncbi:MAG: response regulator [Rubrivivax sp.]|nr:response regulator [Rubrivivax sp.]